MSELTFNFDLLFKLVVYILLPTILLVLISRIVVSLCTRKVKENDPEKYYHIINSWLSIVAILITVVLLVVTIIYAFYFISAMKQKGLVESHKVIYYLVFAFPVVPFIFLVYYIIGLVKFRKLKKEEDQEISYQKVDYQASQEESINQFEGFTNPDVSATNFTDSSLEESVSKEDNKEEKKNIELL